jgi:hypothetical protein
MALRAVFDQPLREAPKSLLLRALHYLPFPPC